MYFVVEHEDQLSKLPVSDSCHVHAISTNDYFHPKLSKLSLLYYNNFQEGFILVLDHPEGLCLDKVLVDKFLSSHNKVYLLDKKYHSYFIDTSNAIDLNFCALNSKGKVDHTDCDTLIHNKYYSEYGQESTNKIIPISKHYEKCECLHEKVKDYVEMEMNTEEEDRLVNAYKYVEQPGLCVDISLLKEKYKLTSESWSLQGEFLYSYYNLYNVTGRPTNAFNGVNFLAVPKEKGFRECFVPRNDLLVEFDFDAYHLRLISKLIGYDAPKESMHTILGRQYFGKQELTKEEYAKSKEITFQMLYGGIQDEYKNIEFFSSLGKYINEQWKKYVTFGGVTMPTGRLLKRLPGMNKLKLFNYLVQNMETKANVERIEAIQKYLQHKKTKLVLITYDSFLFDFSVQDGKEALMSIKAILESDSMAVKHQWGKNYNFDKK